MIASILGVLAAITLFIALVRQSDYVAAIGVALVSIVLILLLSRLPQ